MCEDRSATLELAMNLIARESVTPADAGCQNHLADRLAQRGFQAEHMPANGVSNLWCRHGTTYPVLTFAGHTDVVPVGALENWHHPPFEPTIEGDWLYGRGAADMKGSVASMVVAGERFVSKHPKHKGTLAFLFTSDEEGIATHGTKYVMQQLQARGEHFDWCVVGEPSSKSTLGDTIRVGRRGSLSGTLVVNGSIGHVAYPHLTPNVVHHSLAVLSALTSREWDEGNSLFPPTTFQISNVSAGTGAGNVIPGQIHIDFNFRFNTEHTPEGLQQEVECELSKLPPMFTCDLDWHLSGMPFVSNRGKFMKTIFDIVHSETKKPPIPSTSGGTSDGRFIVPYGVELVELGPVNATIHKYNERVSITELESLTNIYERILETLLQ